jgi:predicted enzyme related to lactoylglutathione lyase
MQSPPLGGAVVYAKGLESLVEFYRAVLQAETLQLEPEYAVLLASGMQLVIHAIPAHIAAEIEISNPPEPREEQAIKLVFTISSLAFAREAAAASGGSVSTNVWQWQGFNTCSAMDPEGNIFQVREAVSAA